MPFDDQGGFAPALGDQGAYQGSDREPTLPDYGPVDPWALPYVNPDGTPRDTTGGGDTGPPAPTDWASVLGIYGMPPDVAAKVGQIFAQYADVNEATQIALAYIRGTDWYKATYPGIQAGMQNGLVRNEADYRAYMNEVNQYYRQYYGRDATGAEIADFLTKGTSAPIVGKTLEGNAYAATYKSDIEYYAGNFGEGQLSQEDLNAYGQEKVGLGSAAGDKIQKMIDQAVQRYQGAFGGSLARPQEALGPVGLASPSLAGQKESLSKAPDVGAA